VWVDANGNGTSDAGELKTLAELGIVSISLNRIHVGGTNEGATIGYEATFTRADGSTGLAQTVYFQTDKQDTVDNTPAFTAAEGVDTLPLLPGSGNIYAIAYKASNDTGFRTAWTALTDQASSLAPAELSARFEALMLTWAGADTAAAGSRGAFVDARHLAFVEAFFGDTYREIQRGEEVRNYPSTVEFGAAIEASYQQIVTLMMTAYLAQVVPSLVARASDSAAALASALTSPYFAYALLDFRSTIPEGEEPSATPGNLGMVVDTIKSLMPTALGDGVNYLEAALAGLDGMIALAFAGSRAGYAAFMTPLFADTADADLRLLAAEIVSGTALIGSMASEAALGSDGSNVFDLGKGDDASDGAKGGDLYIYRRGDGNDWIGDSSKLAGETDTLLLPDLMPSDLQFVRIGETLYIKITSTGEEIQVNAFFSRYGEDKYGIDKIRFADGSEWNRARITAETVFEGERSDDLITGTAGNDLIRGMRGDDLLRPGAGSDTIRYAAGDGNDVIEDTGASTSDTDTLWLANLKPSDVELSRVGEDLQIKVLSTGQIITDRQFFRWSGSAADWAQNGHGIEQIKFADGTVWDRTRLQKEAWLRGDATANGLGGSGLDETLDGGARDDVLAGAAGSDTYRWAKGQGNDFISEDDETGVDKLILEDVASGGVRLSYQGDTLLITILATGEVIQVDDQFKDVGNLLTEANVKAYGLEQIAFSDGVAWDRAEIARQTGQQFLGRAWQADTGNINGVNYANSVDEFGHSRHVSGGGIGFYDGTIALGTVDDISTPNVDESLTADLLVGGSPGDVLSGGKDYLDGNRGDDTLIGKGGDDVLIGGEGNDTLWGDAENDAALSGSYEGHDILDGGYGDDVVHGGGGLDQLSGGAGNDELYGGAGKDYLWDSSGNDLVDGGTGDDVITSGYNYNGGSDTFIYRSGDGNDIINDPTYGSLDASTDKLRLIDLNAADIELARDGNDLLVRVKSNGETIRIVNQFEYETTTANPGVEIIEFADGTQWTRATMQQNAAYRGSDGRDTLIVSADTDDVVEAGKGDDVIISGSNSMS
ncbi:MAG: hypothetical protein F9K44_13630, partial [Hyphomicrobiaceae bacterium]